MGKKRAAAGDDGPTVRTEAAESCASIEAAMQELTAIVAMLESGQGSLDDSLQQFERGTALLRYCHQQLDAAAQRIEIVTRSSESGELLTAIFESAATVQTHSRGRPTQAAPDQETADQADERSLF